MVGPRSWDLKVERAEHHLDEVKTKMAAYAARNPFRATRVRQPRGQRHIWLYRLEMTEEPDPMIPVIVGECLYDLRSALDHLAVAMAPRSRKASAAFPGGVDRPMRERRSQKLHLRRGTAAQRLHLQDQGHARRRRQDDHGRTALPAREIRTRDTRPYRPPRTPTSIAS